MTVWRVQPLVKRYLFGAPSIQPLDGPASLHRTGLARSSPARRPPDRTERVASRPGARIAPHPDAARRRNASIAPALGWLLGGYAIISALVAWMLANGNPEHGPLRALAPISLLISIFVAIAALGAAVFAKRRYMVVAIGTLGLSVGVVVASAGAMVTASF